MISSFYNLLIELLSLTSHREVLWLTFPLAIATLVMLFYFEKYNDERPGWNTYVANSLVLLFVSVSLFRYLYSIDGAGVVNFVEFSIRFLVTFGLLIIGILILFLNFEHFLPERIADYLSSPLTLNLTAYTIILYVYSSLDNGFGLLVSLLIILVSLLITFSFLRIPIKKMFRHLEKMKEREKFERIEQERKPLREKKKEFKKIEKKAKQEERHIEQEERQFKKQKIREFDKQKNEAIKLKKVVKE